MRFCVCLRTIVLGACPQNLSKTNNNNFTIGFNLSTERMLMAYTRVRRICVLDLGSGACILVDTNAATGKPPYSQLYRLWITFGEGRVGRRTEVTSLGPISASRWLGNNSAEVSAVKPYGLLSSGHARGPVLRLTSAYPRRTGANCLGMRSSRLVICSRSSL